MNLLSTLFLFVLTASLSSCTGSYNKWSDKAVVKIDQQELKASDFSQRLALKLKNFDALTAKDISIFSRAKNEVIDEFIIEALSIKWSQEKGFQLKNSLVKEEFLKIKNAYPDELSFKMALATEGVSLDLWLKKLRTTLLQKYVFEKITESVEKPTPEELKAYFKANPSEFRSNSRAKIRQIVLKSENNAKRILKELKKGQKLKNLAKKYSIAPEASKEGLLGWVEKGTSKVFDEALKRGRGIRHKIYKSSFGFHIIEILDIKKGKRLRFNEAEQQIVSKLLHKKKQQIFAKWLESELRKSRVFKDEALIQSIYAETKG